jgi:hypothetical protein
MKTTVELVTKLQAYADAYKAKYEAGEFQKPSDYEKLLVVIKNAKIGNYHNFLSSFATPKIELARDLFDCGLLNTMQDVMDGVYDDESPDDLPDQK